VLKSDDTYLPDMSGEIVAYRRDGSAPNIPEHFFIRQSGNSSAVVSPQENARVCDAADNWLRETLSQESAASLKASIVKPARLNILLDQCAPNAPEPDDIQAWQDMRDVGREVLDSPSREEIWTVAVKTLGDAQACRWMKASHPQLDNRSPNLCVEESGVFQPSSTH
jgi:antitoxin component of MazEF toxin-antitoxin module